MDPLPRHYALPAPNLVVCSTTILVLLALFDFSRARLTRSTVFVTVVHITYLRLLLTCTCTCSPFPGLRSFTWLPCVSLFRRDVPPTCHRCAMLVPHFRLLSLYCTALVHANGNVPDVYSVYHPQHDLSKASRCFCHYMRLPDAFEMVSSRTDTQRAGIKSP